MTAAWHIRPWHAGDSVAALTALVRRAYAPLAAAGMNFTAATQDDAMTRQRIAGAHTLVAVRGDTLLGSITVAGPFDANRQPWARTLPWFYRQDVAHGHQYAVDPAAQGQGIGAALLQAAEAWAAGQGQHAMVLDTAMPATGLRQRYARAGYADVDSVQWPAKTYRSVVMCKALAGTTTTAATAARPAPTANDAEHRAATVRALWACFQARDWAAARRFFADDASLFWRASGEHLDDADAILRVQQIYPEGWTLHILEATPLADGRVHSLVQVLHGGQCFLAHTLWTWRGGLIAQADETWATAETPPAWRTAEAIGAYRRVPLPGCTP